MNEDQDAGARRDAETSLDALGARTAKVEAATGHREQDALTFAGQREINIMWESTQKRIALWTMGAFLVDCVLVAVGQLMGIEVEIPPSLAGVVGYVVGAYFNRTNHKNLGGVGVQPPHSETGR